MQENSNITKKIVQRIDSYPEGEVFYIQKFLDLGDYDSIKTILARLETLGAIRRMIRGVYEKPAYNTRIQEYIEPNPRKVASAIAEKNGWTIMPSGNTALNYLGISTQVPNVWEFVSSGPSREYVLANYKITFLHREDREFSGLSEKTALVTQALRAIGRDRINAEIITNFAVHLDPKDCKKMLEEGKTLPLWIYDCFKRMSEELDVMSGRKDAADA